MDSARSLLIVEDDAAFARALRRSFQRRGYEVEVCEGLEALPDALESALPDYAVVDLKLSVGSGLKAVKMLHDRAPEMRIVVLTGYASLATAVEAIKLGACHYLAKPANTDEIEAAFGKMEGDADVALTRRKTSLKTLEWERIHETLVEAEFNISEAARRLGMHRRTLARKLEKRRVS
ncbi:response regulator transcription factor [Aquamicrobium sp. NLF2-7]|uniref:response regulator transcription factor n=1 Tax=Aquamicrobium sp. NLF2-7 TaxID=2918753 RepID=UPI001EFAA1FB|nr:response regulator transcription factor [Aquamicrobium sp. NLF2-7]MCG8273380.1 response regulator transcription factor [Aquamicrobium sp. NLF2-7]